MIEAILLLIVHCLSKKLILLGPVYSYKNPQWLELANPNDNTNLKISGNVGKGSGKSVVESPFGEDIFKGEGPIDKNFKITYTKKFKGGGIARGCGKVMGDRRKVTKMY